VTFLQALRYFFREASVNLVRGARVSLLAVLTITVSLVLGGVFLLASSNLAGSVARWRGEMRVVFYLQADAPPATLDSLAAELRREPWAGTIEPVTPAAARARFQNIFPTLADLVEGWRDEPLPASVEVALQPGAPTHLDDSLARWRKRPEIAMVDDDRDWLSQLETIVSVVRVAGIILGGVLLAAAVFTIGSIIRLTAYLHHEETGVLRLVGATEFYIRGPFYTEGLLQGFLGGLLATGVLYGAFVFVHAKRPVTLLSSIFASSFLTPAQMGLIVLLGAGAGLFGAVASLRRESL
jgi:cell division transport system permease protein